MSRRMLVADDDPEMLASVAAVLIASGAEVVTAASGAELIERLVGAGPFDLMVTDVAMPWISGLQVARASRASGLRMPILIMTALADGWIAEQVDKLGDGVHLLRKPFRIDELEDAVDALAPR